MKTKILILITLALTMMGGAYAATNPILNITGSASPWDNNASSVVLADLGTVQEASSIFSGLAGGSVTNLASVIDLNITTGDFSALGIRVFDDFLGINTTGMTRLFNTYFLLNTVDDVITSSSSIGQSLRVDTHLQAIIEGVDQGSFGFRWELSHNGITGSYSVSTLPLTPQNVGDVPVPAAVWLFGSSLIGLASFTRRKTSVTKV